MKIYQREKRVLSEEFANKVRVNILGLSQSGRGVAGMSKTFTVGETTVEEVYQVLRKSIENKT